MEKDIKITVLMPVYNAETFLNEAIQSILNQSFSDFEFLIINDGSSDNSKNIIAGYKDPRIRYVENHQNIKLISTLNNGIALSEGKYIVRMDADDISLPDRLLKLYNFMERNPDVALCGSWFRTFGDEDRLVKYAVNNEDIRIRMLHQTQFCHPSVILKRSIFGDNNYKFDMNYLHAEDYELFVRIAEKYKVSNIPEVLLKYRIHNFNVSNLYNDVQVNNTRNIIMNQFRNLKKDFDDNDFNLYLKFAYSEFDHFDSVKIKKLDELITVLIKENESIKYLPHIRLKDYWTDKLFNLCYNIDNSLYIWENSFFYDRSKLTALKIIKRFLKNFIKI